MPCRTRYEYDLDLDLKIEKKKDVKEGIKFNGDLCYNTEASYDAKLNFNEIITLVRNTHQVVMIGFILVSPY